MIVVKVCGMRDVEHMAVAADAGADMLGMVFLPTVRRYVTPDDAAALAEAFRLRMGAGPGPTPRLVGLFADQPAAHVNAVAAHVGLDAVQLCGAEDADYLAQVERPALKVLHVPAALPGDAPARAAAADAVAAQIQAVHDAGHTALLDRESSVQPGGMGRPFDWAIAREMAERGHRFILAGGLTPESVAAAIDAARPYGVDVSTGVETGGVKDPDKIRRFVAAARKGATV